jgi:homocitrate synthase NifV
MATFDRNKSIWVVDSTLRERSMMRGREYSEAEKLKIAQLLALSGVNEIEAGIPARGPHECRAIRQIKIDNPGTLVTCWVKASMASIELAARCSVKSIHICFPEETISHNISSTQFEKALAEMKSMIDKCFESFDLVSVGISNPFSGDLIKLNRFISKASDYGAHRVRLADSQNAVSAENVKSFFETVKTRTSASLEFHGHNAGGLGIENTLSSIYGGADAVSLTVNGLGENGGVACLEDVGPALLSAFQYTDLNFYKLKEVARMVTTLENRRKVRRKSVNAA